MKKILFIAFFVVVSGCVSTIYLTTTGRQDLSLGSSKTLSAIPNRPIELSELIELFMTNQDEYPSWSMGAGKTGRQIKWLSIGVEGKKSCGSYNACRKATARVSLGKKELQILRERREPVQWEIFMASSRQSKFGPELIMIDPYPSCHDIEGQCSFEFKKVLETSGFKLQQLCHAGPGFYEATGFLVTRQTKSVFVVYERSEGSSSGGNSLTLYWDKPITNESFCADAENMEIK